MKETFYLPRQKSLDEQAEDLMREIILNQSKVVNFMEYNHENMMMKYRTIAYSILVTPLTKDQREDIEKKLNSRFNKC